MKTIYKKVIVLGALLMMASGCSNGGTTYSLLASGQSFKQAKVNSKVDLLWVVDNSGSMLPLQTNLTNNLHAFIDQFVTKDFDFHIAVTSSDAYLSGAFFSNN